MAFWEFLIQKEGDRSWLPLESSDVEILEGRYRIVARSSRVDTLVEIRITHETTTEFLPIRRVQKRSSRINKDGLVVIFPYTRLLPGTWELRCLGDVMTEMMEDGWQYRVKLQVLPLESAAEEWEPEPSEGVTEAEAANLDEPLEAREDIEALSSSQPSVSEIEASEPPDNTELAPAAVLEPIAAELQLSQLSDSVISSTDPEPPSEAEVLVAREGVDSASQLAIADTVPDSTTDSPWLEAANPAASLTTSPMFQMAEQLSEQIVDSVFQDFAPVDELLAASARETEARDAEGASLSHSESATQASAPRLQKVEASVPSLRLRLERETYVIRQGQSLIVKGQVEPLEVDQPPAVAISKLRVRLYDPQNAQVLVDEYQSLSDRPLPLPFSCTISLPASYQTYLLLGELTLYGVSADEPPVLATRSFSVTTDLHELLEAIANDFTETDSLPRLEVSLSGMKQPASSLDTNLLTLAADASQPSDAPASPQFRLASRHPLPPQLHTPEPSQDRKPPQLPLFGKHGRVIDQDKAQEGGSIDVGADPEATAANLDSNPPSTIDELAAKGKAEVTEPLGIDPEEAEIDLEINLNFASSSESTEQPDSLLPEAWESEDWTVTSRSTASLAEAMRETLPAGASEISAVSTPQPEDAEPIASLLSLPVMAVEQNSIDPALDWNSIEPRIPCWQRQPESPELPVTPEDAAFRALKLQERFWTRLQSLATDMERSSWLSGGESAVSSTATTSVPSSSTAEDLEDFRKTAARKTDHSIGLDANLVTQEIVIDDEFPPISQRRTGSPTQTQAPPSSATWMLPDDEPVPVPRLEVKKGELTAGRSVDVIVKLPNPTTKVFIKLWMCDRQSRAVLDGPRWLMDLLPDGLGNLIVRTQIIPPFDSLEIQLEAIAVEIATYRESDKTTLTREVVPPDLSAFSLDEWDM